MSQITEEEFFNKVQQNAPDIPRFSWMPESSKTCPKSRPPTLVTKFGGDNPWMKEGAEWPVCDECGDKKSFICQVNFEDLPKEFQDYCGVSSGLFQFFFCTECTPFEAVTSDVNIVPKEELGTGTLKGLSAATVAASGISTEELPSTLKKDVDQLKGKSSKKGTSKKAKKAKKQEEETNQVTYEEFFITGWKKNEKLEIPSNYSEITDMLDRIGVDEEAYEEFNGDLNDYEDHKDLIAAYPGIKLCGYICFVQDKEYPDCPKCGKSMTTTFLQLCQDDILDFSWGDCGVGHVTFCPDCKVPALGWACG